VKRFRGGLVFKAHRLLYHSTLGLRVIKKKKRDAWRRSGATFFCRSTDRERERERERARERERNRERERERESKSERESESESESLLLQVSVVPPPKRCQHISNVGLTLKPFHTFRVSNTRVCTENNVDRRFAKHNILVDTMKRFHGR